MKLSRQPILVKDRRTLQMERLRLQRLCEALEYDAEQRIQHLQKHYGAMAFNSLFPNATAEMSMAKLLGAALKGAFKSNRFKSGVVTAIITFVEIVGVRKLVSFFETLFSKKDTVDTQNMGSEKV